MDEKFQIFTLVLYHKLSLISLLYSREYSRELAALYGEKKEGWRSFLLFVDHYLKEDERAFLLCDRRLLNIAYDLINTSRYCGNKIDKEECDNVNNAIKAVKEIEKTQDSQFLVFKYILQQGFEHRCLFDSAQALLETVEKDADLYFALVNHDIEAIDLSLVSINYLLLNCPQVFDETNVPLLMARLEEVSCSPFSISALRLLLVKKRLNNLGLGKSYVKKRS